MNDSHNDRPKPLDQTSQQDIKRISELNSHSNASSKSHGSHSHSGGHSHAHSHAAVSNIRVAFFLNLFFSLVELVGGIMTGSMAIIADAIHDCGDAISLGTGWWLESYANKRGDKRFNFGYRRFSLLSALISGVVISTGSIIVLYKAAQRFLEPVTPNGPAMIYLALFGLAVNGFAAWRLSRGKTQNEKMLTWHLLEDLFGWSIVLIGAIVITTTGIWWIDPVLAILLSIFVFVNVIRHLRDTVYLFLQGRPENFDEELFLKEALAANGVEFVDQLAVWSLDGETSILSARLHLHSVRDPVQIEAIKVVVREAAERQGARATLETCLAAKTENDHGTAGGTHSAEDESFSSSSHCKSHHGTD